MELNRIALEVCSKDARYGVLKRVAIEVDYGELFYKECDCIFCQRHDKNTQYLHMSSFYQSRSFTVHPLNFCCIILLHNMVPDLLGGACRITKYLL